MLSMNDDLIARARGGDRMAMEQLLSSVAPSIKRFANRMCRHEADAEDVLQDTLLSIATNLGDFQGRSALPSWTFAITRSACARKRRGKKNAPTEADARLEDHPAEEPGPGDRAEARELGSLVERALDGLPEEHREVLLLRDAEGLSGAEAAAALGISLEALKSRLHRARAALREALRPILERDDAARSADCPDVVRALSEKLEGDLDAKVCEQMEEHVRGCDACGRTCDVLHDALAACRASPTSSLTPELESRVRRAVTRWIESRSKS